MDRQKFPRLLQEILSFTKIAFTTYAVIFFVNNVLIANAYVPSGSMEPTLETGSRFILNRLAYLEYNAPQRGDIIVFYPPDEGEVTYISRIMGLALDKEKYVKRVIGLPGETIEGRNGRIYIDGCLLDENYKDLAADYVLTISSDFGPYMIPEDNYFVMGDNRNNSYDSQPTILKKC